MRPPDVICLQETKRRTTPFRRSGSRARASRTKRSTVTRVITVSRYSRGGRSRATIDSSGPARPIPRGVAAEIDGIELHNLYVPAGGDMPDPAINPKFAHKLKFLEGSATACVTRPATDVRPVLVGDLNVAPLRNDVWSHRQFLNVVSHTPVETDRLKRALAAASWVDSARSLHPEPEKLYTWWSYRAATGKSPTAAAASTTSGSRPQLGGRVKRVDIAEDARGWERASDHVPVTASVEV